MKYASIPNQLMVHNRSQLMARLPSDCFSVVVSADVLTTSADGSVRFVQNSDLFYLTGVDQENTTLVLCPDHADPALREVLFVRETSDLIQIWEGHKLSQPEAAEVSGIETVLLNDLLDEHIRDLAQTYQNVFLNHNEHARSSSPLGITPDERFRARLQSLYPDHRYDRLAPILTDLRQTKHPVELALLERACQITDLGFRRVLGFVQPGVNEYEIEAEFAHEFLRHGSRGFAYEPIIASGANACVLHYLSNDQVCQEGDLLLMDVAAEYGNYNADLSRTIPVSGKFTERQRQVYEAVLRVFRLCIDELIVPGKSIRETYLAEVGRAMEEELIGLGLLDRDAVDQERAQDPPKQEAQRLYRQYFMHGTSHSLGLDVHDVTPCEPVFVDGMVVTVEPGIYIPDESIGVRLENDVVVKAGGNIDLMAGIPIEVDEIEAIMAEN